MSQQTSCALKVLKTLIKSVLSKKIYTALTVDNIVTNGQFESKNLKNHIHILLYFPKDFKYVLNQVRI